MLLIQFDDDEISILLKCITDLIISSCKFQFPG